MKSVAAVCAAFLGLGIATAGADDRPITQVVKLLQDMLEKSKADGSREEELYAKYKCYCDDNEATKTEEVESLTENIAMLEGKIEQLLSSSALLSEEYAEAKKNFDTNQEAMNKAQALRQSEESAFNDLSKDLTGGIAQMKAAIDALAEVGADQTLSQSAPVAKDIMSDSSLLKLKVSVKQALLAASAVVTTGQKRKLGSFLQTPFTGSYSSQSGEVVGILKEMRDTFEANLKEAETKEEKAKEAYGEYMDTMQKANGDLSLAMSTKEGGLSNNDGDLATKRSQLTDARKQKDSSETFLADLVPSCAAKAKEWDARKLLRANEDAAISEAISILNSDAAFETFGKVKATSEGSASSPQLNGGSASFLQIRAQPQQQQKTRQRAQGFLRHAASAQKSTLIARALALLEAENPFAVVVAEIQKMITLIAEEETADDEKLEWCNGERNSNNGMLTTKNSQIETLNEQISSLTEAIHDPVSGLKADIKNTEAAIQENAESQKEETEDRVSNNQAYQKNIENLQGSLDLLTKAITVLKKYYSDILQQQAGGALLQKKLALRQTPPETWDEGGFVGQSNKGGDAIGLLEYILTETQKEETSAHKKEETSQHAYEDMMAKLKSDAATSAENLANLQVQLATKEESLLGKEEDLKTTQAEKEALEKYLAKIKPECDFITLNIDTRKSNRQKEKEALEQAQDLLKDTPHYKAATGQTSLES